MVRSINRHLVRVPVAHEIAHGVPGIVAVPGRIRHICPKHVFSVQDRTTCNSEGVGIM